MEVKYDILRYGDQGTWQKHPDKYSQHEIVDPYLSSMSQTSYSWKKTSRWKNITHTRARVHTHNYLSFPHFLVALEEYSYHLLFHVTIFLAVNCVAQWELLLQMLHFLLFLAVSSTEFFAYNVMATKTKLTFHQEIFTVINLKLFVF